MSIFNLHTKEQHTNSLAHHMPSGKAWLWKFKGGSDGRQFLTGVACELLRSEALLKRFYDELDPRYTTDFIEEWEHALGIPDTCFPGNGPIEQRRLHVVVKLASLGVQTAQDFVNLAAILGVYCTVESGSLYGKFPRKFTALFSQNAGFIIVVTFNIPLSSRFPRKLPYKFSRGTSSLIKCLFEHLKPADCKLVIRGR